MIKKRRDMEEEERRSLAPYAQKVADSAGRNFDDPVHPFRTHYQRDRARVVHSRAFRRLEHKTQVFLSSAGDHLRNRLTHTIEVASISRTIACGLGANEDLTETIALAHDLGHSPFGHAGEEKLNELMQSHGGFEHNVQSLRIVELIETKYPRFPGLNLTYEVREGLQKHAQGFKRPAFKSTPEEQFENPSIEAQIANLADEITYYSHDLDDGLDHQLLNRDQLMDIEIWRKCCAAVEKHFPGLEEDQLDRYVIRVIIDHAVKDVLNTTNQRLEEAGVQSADDVRRHPEKLVAYSTDLRRQNQQLRKFLYHNLYYNKKVHDINQDGCSKIEMVFNQLLSHPGDMGDYARHVDERTLPRTVCDYVSGMTDNYLSQEFERLSSPNAQPARKQ